jgi:hypothetical protein
MTHSYFQLVRLVIIGCHSFDQRTGHTRKCAVTFWSRYGVCTERRPEKVVRDGADESLHVLWLAVQWQWPVDMRLCAPFGASGSAAL